MPIRHQSGRLDISSDRGHTSPGSYPSTMKAPPSNQDGLHRIQVIQRTQEVFGRTLRDFLRACITSPRCGPCVGTQEIGDGLKWRKRNQPSACKLRAVFEVAYTLICLRYV